MLVVTLKEDKKRKNRFIYSFFFLGKEYEMLTEDEKRQYTN